MRLKSGEEVVERYISHRHDGLAQLLPIALARIDAKGRQFLVEEVVFDHVVGETICVVTGPEDEIVYAIRPKRFGHTRFVKNRCPEPCNSVVVILKTADGEQDAGKYVLVTAFVGHLAEPEPWDKNATEKSVEFWASHALVWGREEVVSGTATTVCPW